MRSQTEFGNERIFAAKYTKVGRTTRTNQEDSTMTSMLNRKTKIACLAVLGGLLVALGVSVQAEGLDAKLKDSEAKRIKAIEMVKPAVVAIFAPGGQGGGSGV